MGDKTSKSLVTRTDKINYVADKFSLGDTVNHLHKMMKSVTDKEITCDTVTAACMCVGKLNETIDTAIKAAKFLSDHEM